MSKINVDDREIKKFDDVADIWWDADGEMGTLQTINPLRMAFITEMVDLSGKKVLDVGCGGGILAEALAAAGAEVTGIDLSRESLAVARNHAKKGGLEIDYKEMKIEELLKGGEETYDVIACMEMLEHVPVPAQIVKICSALLKKGGLAVFSSINRTPKAFLFAIIAGEYILGLLPKGTHSYSMLIRPREMKAWGEAAGLNFHQTASLIYNPILDRFKVAYNREDVNYMMRFTKP